MSSQLKAIVVCSYRICLWRPSISFLRHIWNCPKRCWRSRWTI